jgi:hypothetical protein
MLAVVLNAYTSVWFLWSWFFIDHIIWKFHIIWKKFRYFEMEWYPKIFSISGNFGFYILCSFARYIHKTLFRGGLLYYRLTTTQFLKNPKWQAGSLLPWLSFKAQEVSKFIWGSLILQCNRSAFSGLPAGWMGPQIHIRYLLLIWSKNNFNHSEMFAGASYHSLQDVFWFCLVTQYYILPW